jgi:hypothetical protein
MVVLLKTVGGLDVFTKQHFQAIADLIKNSDASDKAKIAQDLVKLFQADNDRFDAQRFLKACCLMESA